MSAEPFPGAHEAAANVLPIFPLQEAKTNLLPKFSARHADRFRYVAKWGRWLRWDGVRWVFESTLLAFDEARAVAREFANVARDPAIAKASIVAAIVSLARADRRHAAIVDQWDADPWLLNTPSGTVDLRSGATLARMIPRRYITKITAVAPGGDVARCGEEVPRWKSPAAIAICKPFCSGSPGTVSPAASASMPCFFCYGTGGNGKGVFLNTLAAILADYAAVAPMETFIATQGERHPTDLAGLRGARLVTAQETERGRRWAESKIRALTGGDPISARFMRQDFFTYSPTFKLIVIAGNHKPGAARG